MTQFHFLVRIKTLYEMSISSIHLTANAFEQISFSLHQIYDNCTNLLFICAQTYQKNHHHFIKWQHAVCVHFDLKINYSRKIIHWKEGWRDCIKENMRKNESKKESKKKKSSHMKTIFDTRISAIAEEISIEMSKSVKRISFDFKCWFEHIYLYKVYRLRAFSTEFLDCISKEKSNQMKWNEMKWKYFLNEIALRRRWSLCVWVRIRGCYCQVRNSWLNSKASWCCWCFLFLLLNHSPQVIFQT